MKKHKLFLDANVLFSAAYREQAGLLVLWQLKNVTLCSSQYAVHEALRNLSDVSQKNRLQQLLEPMEIISTEQSSHTLEVDLKEKDKPIILGAIKAKADYLITGDFRDFGKYFGKTIQGVIILPPAEYLKSESQRS